MKQRNRVRGNPLKRFMKKWSGGNMKRVVMLLMTCMLLLSGCQSVAKEPQSVKKVYTAKTEVGEGLQLEEKWIIEGLDNDFLTKTTMIYTYSFDDTNAWENYLTELTGLLDQRIAELQGPKGSHYIIMEYMMDGNILVVSETTDYEAADKSNEAVMRDDVIKSGEYYSMSKLCENFDLQKYTLEE